MANLKINTNIRGFKSSIKQLKRGLVHSSMDAMSSGADQVVANIQRRLSSSIGGGNWYGIIAGDPMNN